MSCIWSICTVTVSNVMCRPKKRSNGLSADSENLAWTSFTIAIRLFLSKALFLHSVWAQRANQVKLIRPNDTRRCVSSCDPDVIYTRSCKLSNWLFNNNNFCCLRIAVCITCCRHQRDRGHIMIVQWSHRTHACFRGNFHKLLMNMHLQTMQTSSSDWSTDKSMIVFYAENSHKIRS